MQSTEVRSVQTHVLPEGQAARSSGMIEERGRAGDFEIYLIPAAFGDPEGGGFTASNTFLQRLIRHFTSQPGYVHEAFVQVMPLQNGESAYLFSDHAKDWIPDMGLGIWPHRDPPRMWTKDDFDNGDPRAGLPTLMHPVFRITTKAEARLNCLSVMGGTGSSLHVISKMPGPELLKHWTDLLLPTIKDRVFRSYTWYAPLLDVAGFSDPLAPLTAAALQNTSLYIRESLEDSGTLIASREALESVLTALGCSKPEKDKRVWRLAA